MAGQYISGEQYKEMVTTAQPKRNFGGPLVIVVAVVVLLAAGFTAGVGYQKGHQNSASSQAGNAGGAGGSQFGRFNGRRGTLGSVTAVSDTSLTVQDVRTNTSTTFSITSSTQISNAGVTATASSIKVGDTVLVRADQSNSKQAARILISPSMGGGPAPSSNSSGTAPSTSGDQTITN